MIEHRLAHDVGGLPADPVPTADHQRAEWEKRTDAMVALLRQLGLTSLDEVRRHVESLGGDYRRLAYGERTLHAMMHSLLERGVLAVADYAYEMTGKTPSHVVVPFTERDRRRQEANDDSGGESVAPQFHRGEWVQVKRAYPPGHVRTPFYCRGKVGRVERLCGAFANPEELAYRRSGLPAQPLYRVRFTSRELWPDAAEPSDDGVEIEIYQHWLDRASDPEEAR